MRRIVREAGVSFRWGDLVAGDESLSVAVEIMRESLERYGESLRRGNRSLVDWVGEVLIRKECFPETKGAVYYVMVKYIKVPLKWHSGRVLELDIRAVRGDGANTEADVQMGAHYLS